MKAHTFNMYAGAILGSVLFFLLLGFFAELIFVGRGHPEHEPLAFAIEIEAEAEGGHEEAATDWAALIAAADPAKGEKLFKKCSACHKVEDGVNGVGPNLWGVVGRDIASVAGYAYSDTLSGMEGDWSFEQLQAFLESPKAMAAGTKMTFKGLSKPEDRVNLIVYLNQADGSPIELAEAAAETEVAAAAETATETAVETVVEAVTETASETATETVVEPVTETATETVAAVTEAIQEATAAAPGGGGLGDLLAAADAEAGKKVFKKCKACHKIEEGKNGLGPSLWGVVGRDIASAEGFKKYSDAMTGMDGDWTAANLFAFIEAPKAFLPGTKMTFPGVKDAQDRANLIAYLNEADGSPIELAGAAAAATAVAATAEAATEAVTETTTETVVETVTEAVKEPVAETATETAVEPATETTTETATETVAAATQGTEPAAPAAGADFGELLVATDIDVLAGEKIFRKCRACHKVEEGKNGVGPSLFGVVNRDVASVEGFKYSDAMKAREGSWTGADLFTYLENPRGVVPGSKMAFPGLKNPQDRINVIIFLNEVDGSPEPLE